MRSWPRAKRLPVAIVVQKYGGSSVASVEKIGLVAERVVAERRKGSDVVVVVSAMGKSTDDLIALAKQIDDAPPRRELDMLLTTGERVTMALLSMAIQKRGVDAISFTGSQSGIITNDRHFDARIIEVRPHRIEDELARGRVVIVAGYQGMSYRREITTLGRGGSDTTAIALAAALGAERAEIYSDVDGVYSADPRVVADAAHFSDISYEAMQEMAEAGARVLNAAAVEFARRAKIAIHARSTFGSERETRVHEGVVGATAVVGQKGVVRVRWRDAAYTQEIARRLETLGAESKDFEATEAGGEFLIATGLAPDWRALVSACSGPSTDIEENLGLVSVVGHELTRSESFARALAEITAARSSTVRRVRVTPMRVSFLVGEDAVDELVRELHGRLVG